MAVQMYLIQPKQSDDDHARATIAEFVADRQGFVLMATTYGSLIVAFDDVYLDSLKAHPQVDFVGGVTLNPEAPGAAALQQLFAENLAQQLGDRMAADAPSADAFPPGYRPLRWPGRAQEGGA